jgi:ribosomal protein L12E/L44/L45/RPP1/RPP2
LHQKAKLVARDYCRVCRWKIGKVDIIILIFISEPQMKYLAAYALLALSGKKDISKLEIYSAAKDLKALLNSVQSNASDDDINKVIAAVKGKAVHQLIAEGQSRLGSSAPVVATGKVADKKEAPKK